MAARLHLRGHLLPGEDVRDLWVVDGMISRTPVRDAQTICDSGWILPGLVDAHCHVGLAADGPVTDDVAEAQACSDRDAGVLLIRDAGSASETRWMDDRADLPPIVRAGRHIARPRRYLRNYGDEVEPPDLVAAVERQAARGDGWVKLVGDWIDREAGDLTPLWPAAVAAAAIDRAHQIGVRVTAHVFGEQAASELVRAGIDGIEHGTGLDADTIALMARHQVALVPTMLQIANFESFARAGEQRFPAYAAHMRALAARHATVIRSAHEAGVPIYAGTDAGGFIAHGLVGHEIARLATLIGPEAALAGGSWGARAWLGRPDRLRDGVPADLVVFPADPLNDPRVLSVPQIVILRGRVVVG